MYYPGARFTHICFTFCFRSEDFNVYSFCLPKYISNVHCMSQFLTCTRLISTGILLNGYNRYASIDSSEFSFLGASGVAAWGITNGYVCYPLRVCM